MSSARMFEPQKERVGGQFKTVSRLWCSKCGCAKAINIKATGGLFPPDQIKKKFEQIGWEVGPNTSWDFCPACANQRKDKPVLKLVEKPISVAAEHPREMTREDKRLVFAKLNEVYLDEKRGYDSGWSDHRVATDLGVPRKWVELVRVENFGALGTNEDMIEFMTEAKALCVEAKSALEAAKKAREDVETILKNPAFLSLSDISVRISKIDRLAGEVRKLVVLS